MYFFNIYFFNKLFYTQFISINVSIVVYNIILLNIFWCIYNKLNVLQLFIFAAVVIYLFYWFYTVFIYLIKKSYLSKFTTLIQRFWKRSFMLFWLIEIFLFCVYLFLICNNPEETFYFLDFNKFYKNFYISLIELLVKTIYLVYIIYYCYLLIIISKVASKNYFYLFIGLIYFYLYIELNQLFYINNLFYNYIYTYDFDDNIWGAEIDIIKLRVYYYYIYLFAVLKYWHILYIYIYLIIYYWYYYVFQWFSYNWLSVFYQNFLFLYLFNYLYLYVFLKKIIKLNFSVEYYWFFLNCNDIFIFYDFLHSFNIYYLLFI